jgi:hypothetical protein
MRKRVAVVVLLALGASTLLALGTSTRVTIAAPSLPSNPPTAQPGPAPGPRINIPPSISDVRRTPSPTKNSVPGYSEGPISYDAEIYNPSTSALDTELSVHRTSPIPGSGNGPLVTKVSVRVDATSRAWVTFVDPDGVRNGCSNTFLKADLATGASRKIITKPSCTYSHEVFEPLANIPMETKIALRANKVAYVNPTLTSAPKCGQDLGVKATLVNASALKADNARLVLDLPNTSETAKSSAVDVNPGSSSAPLTITQTMDSVFATPGTYTLKIEGGGPPVYQPNWHVKVSRLCTITIDSQ